jgi:hypothetical protein
MLWAVANTSYDQSAALLLTKFGQNILDHYTIVKRIRPKMTIWHMRNARWTHTDKNTHSEYVIRVEFPLQQWLRKRA